MTPIKCFLVEQTGKYTWVLSLGGGASDCPKSPHPRPFNGHRGETVLGIFDKGQGPGYPDEGDPRWPTVCRYCQQPIVFKSESTGLTGSPHYRRADTGEEIVAPLPPGAMFYYDEGSPVGPDGKCLVVCCPPTGHWWYIDSMASNCTVPCKCGHLYRRHYHTEPGQEPLPRHKFDPIDGGKHRCWVRHGTPPMVHVGKEGETCGAGGGSIQISDWHGFLSHGMLQLNR